jgi:mannose-1-phosphate guanylyltransferase
MGYRRLAMVTHDPLVETLRRAWGITTCDRIGAVITELADDKQRQTLGDVPSTNLMVQPRYRGTAYEVLFALLKLEQRGASDSPTIFLPSDHVVSDEPVMMRSLEHMAEWIAEQPNPVYLLGAVPEGPHDQLGYIIPWHVAPQMPCSVYEFIETPDVRQARKLINAGGLWNTFIFGGTVASMLKLFQPKFDATIDALRNIFQDESSAATRLRRLYATLESMDFSRELLSTRVNSLNVLRMPACGWWPLKSPRRDQPPLYSEPPFRDGSRPTSGSSLDTDSN